MDELSMETKIDYLREAYMAVTMLGELGHNKESMRGVAAVRLLLVDLVGEDRQRELIGQWNATAQ